MREELIKGIIDEIGELIDIANQEYNETDNEKIKDKALAQCGAYENVLYVIRKHCRAKGLMEAEI